MAANGGGGGCFQIARKPKKYKKTPSSFYAALYFSGAMSFSLNCRSRCAAPGCAAVMWHHAAITWTIGQSCEVKTLKMLRIIRVFRVFRFSSALARVALMSPG